MAFVMQAYHKTKEIIDCPPERWPGGTAQNSLTIYDTQFKIKPDPDNPERATLIEVRLLVSPEKPMIFVNVHSKMGKITTFVDAANPIYNQLNQEAAKQIFQHYSETLNGKTITLET